MRANRVLATAVVLAAMMPAVGGAVEVLPPNRSNEQTRGAFGRPAYRSKNQPAGSKLWRKAKRGKL